MHDHYPKDLQQTIEFHGHMCPGLAIGYRAAKAAWNRIGIEHPEDEELLAIVESDGCGIDAIQSLLGCTLGKGNLIYLDYGKQSYTVICRKQNKAVRVALKADAFKRTPEQEALFQKVQKGTASEEEHKAFRVFQQERTDQLLSMNEEELFNIQDVETDIPEKARIFKSVTCHFCGEPVMEPRARIRDGKPCCIPCSEKYSRGW